MQQLLPKRGVDDFGSGEYQSSRGDRIHNGVDYTCAPGAEILAPISGQITKIGYPYSGDFHYQYVEITLNDLRHRVFYVSPNVSIGDQVIENESVIGAAQNIAKKYSAGNRVMKNHVHYEIKDEHGQFINPEADNV